MTERLALGIDIGGTSCKLALMDSSGGLHHMGDIPTRARDGGEVLINRLIEAAGQLLRAAPPGSVAGIGIASAGQIDFATGICRYATEALPGWTGMDIGPRMRAAFGLPVWVENDANAAALAELTYGAGQGLSDLICLTLGTGIGGGVVSGGRLVRGAHGGGGELGHIPVEPGGAPCSCGAHGCLEAYASATGILRLAREAGLAAESAAQVYALSAAGDSAARAVTERVARWLAQGIVAMVAAFDPEAVLIGGGVSQAGALLFEPLRGHLDAHPFVRGRCQVRPAALGPRAGVIGAAAQVFFYHNRED
ncbi:MAG: ROK family protein [Symbiobacterium sp.]|uniref:ROK family protein n=1 Tax=Symbiobacterium sp. TaxID=1971213 RepID=UPI003464DC1B